MRLGKMLTDYIRSSAFLDANDGDDNEQGQKVLHVDNLRFCCCCNYWRMWLIIGMRLKVVVEQVWWLVGCSSCSWNDGVKLNDFSNEVDIILYEMEFASPR
jgi:hypothetical protein